MFVYVLLTLFSAVVDALKTLQEKIKRLELERKQAEKTYLQFSHDAQKHQQVASSASANFLGTDDSARKGECKENTALLWDLIILPMML